MATADMSVPGLERGIAILRSFSADRPYLSAPQIASELGIPRSTVHRLLGVLVGLDLLFRADDGRFALAPGVLTLGHACLASLDMVGVSDRTLADLRDQTGWSTHLATRVGRSVIYLVRHGSRAAVTTNIAVGSALPAHATVMGRVLLSALEPAELHSLYGGVDLEAHGPETPRTFEQLCDLLSTDRERGFVASAGYYERGVAAAAAPIRDRSLRVVAAINATGHAGAAATSDFPDITAAVLRAADIISARLGAPVIKRERPIVTTGEVVWA